MLEQIWKRWSASFSFKFLVLMGANYQYSILQGISVLKKCLHKNVFLFCSKMEKKNAKQVLSGRIGASGRGRV
jgi:hypothetical protein